MGASWGLDNGFLVTVLSIAAGYMLLVPLLVITTFKAKAHPQVLKFDPEVNRPPESVSDYFDRLDTELIKLGFARDGSVIVPDMIDNVRAVLSLYTHPRNRDQAMVTALWGYAADIPVEQQKYLEFHTQFNGDSPVSFCTNDNGTPGAFPDKPEAPNFRFPHIDSAARLYRCHQELIETRFAHRHKVHRLDDVFQSDIVRFIGEGVLKEEFEKEIPRGYLRYDAEADVFRSTFWGGFPMAWRATFPGKQVIGAWYRLRGYQLENQMFG